MSVGAICFTSSGSNGVCWVVLVFPRPFLENRVFFPYATYAKKLFTRLTPKKKNSVKKNATYAPQKIKKRVTLISTIELRFPLLLCMPLFSLFDRVST